MKGEALEVRDASAGYALQVEMPVVPEGYKQTEVGVIPEDWAVKKLGELADFRTGPFGSALHKSDYTTGGVPVINPMHIIGAKLMPTVTMTITEAAANKLVEFRLQSNEIVIGRRGDMGRCAVVRENNAGWLCGTGSMIVRPSPRMNPDFLQRILTTSEIIGKIESASVGSTMINLNQATLSNLYVQCPRVKEQRAIATALSDVDALLQALDRLIAKKRDIKQATMQQLLTAQTRLPGFEGEWIHTTLGEVASFYKGKGLSKSAITPNGARRCIHYGELFTRYGATICETISRTDEFLDAFLSVSNDVLMPTSDVTPKGLAKASCVIVDDVVLGGDILIIRCDPDVLDGTFLSYIIRMDEDQVLKLVTGTTVYHLYGSDMKKFEFMMPGVSEQNAIVGVLSDIEDELGALEQRRTKTAALKQAMMQELLTGRTRLVGLQVGAEAGE